MKTINCVQYYPVSEANALQMDEAMNKHANRLQLGKMIDEYYVNEFYPQTDKMVFGIVREYED